tara:strand:+ start:472 stop:5865 length:5394 start_codon:yes stop_codon:yes gene_type:complete
MTTPTIDNGYQTNLLFKRFTGVAATKLDNEFSSENFKSVPNIFSKDVMIEDIPSSAPLAIAGSNGLDASANWADSSFNYVTNTFEESTYYNVNDPNDPSNNMTFAQMFPDSNLKFYKRLSLVPVLSGEGGRVWGCFTDYSGNPMYLNKESVLAHTIPFKFDDILNTYVPIVRYNKVIPEGSAGQQNQIKGAGTSTDNFTGGNAPLNADPLYWIMDAGTGYLQLYATQEELEAVGVEDKKINGIQDPSFAPIISCFVYNGKLGITDLDVSGQVQVGDISGLGQLTGNLERIVLPDGSANVLDICANDAVRSQYNYTRGNLFLGHRLIPIIDNSNVDHTKDPSHNDSISGTIKTYTLDVSGDSHFEGSLVHRTCSALDETCIAFGNNCKASGNLTFAQGTACDASGVSSHAEGTFTVTYAGASSSHAEGFNTKTFGVYSHAEGSSSEAHGQFSHATGLHTIIDTDAGTSIGKFNDTSKNVLFVIGDGTTSTARSDAFMVRTNGDGTYIRDNLDVSGNLDIDGNADFEVNVDIGGNINVIGHGNFNDISASNIEATGGITTTDIVTGISGPKGQFTDLSIKRFLKNMDTYPFVASNPYSNYNPTGAGLEFFEVAYVIHDQSITPLDNVSAYFVFTHNRLGSETKQVLHFIAGIYFHPGGPDGFKALPYVKVLGNTFNPAETRVSNIVIASANSGIPQQTNLFLLLGFDGPTKNPMESCELRMYKNGFGIQEDNLIEPFPAAPEGPGGWIMGKWRGQQGIPPLPEREDLFAVPSSYPGIPGQGWGQTYLNLKIDSTPMPNAYSTLIETFTNNVDISKNLTVGEDGTFMRDLTVKGNLIATTHTVGNLSVVDTITARRVQADVVDVSGSLNVEVNTADNSGVFIKNSFPLANAPGFPQSGTFDECGFPSIKFQDNSLSGGLFPTPTFKEIVVGGQGPPSFLSVGYPQVATGHDDFNILLGSDDMHITGENSSGALSLFINNTNSGGAGIKTRCNNGDNVGTFTMGNNGNTEIISKSDGTNKGFQIGTQSERPESNWYIGSTNNMFAGKAITLTSTSETAGNFSKGEVRINKDYGLLGQSIDFVVDTLTQKDAFKVDCDNNTVNLSVPLVVSDISSSTTGVIDVSADILNLPTNTIIKNRKYWSGTEAATFDLKVDGIEEYSFDTQNISNDEWISVAWVGPPTIQTATKQRASATFEFLNNVGSVHQCVAVNVIALYGTGLSIDVVKNSRFDDGGTPNNRMIKAFRIAYGGTYDGGIFQMQIKDTGASSTDIRLKITKNYNNYGWFCDLSGSPQPDNNPVYYNNGGGHNSGGTVGTPFPNNFPSEYGVNILERLQAYGSTGANGVGQSTDGKSTLFYTSNTVFHKVFIGDELDLSNNDITNVNKITSTNVSATNVTANIGNFSTVKQRTGNQLVIGDAANFSTKFVQFRNMFNVYTNLTSRSSAETQITNASLPGNYLIGYSDSNEKGGLIYRANMGSSSSYFNKLITTTSLGYFSTNYFRTITGVSTIQSRKTGLISMAVNSGIYKTPFFYTDNLITNPGHNNWYPGSASYPIWSGNNDMGGDSEVNSMKFMQLPRDQLIRVLSFVFEGYNTKYRFRALGNPNSFVSLQNNFPGCTVAYNIVFGFGNSLGFQNNGPFSTTGSANFIKCFEFTTTGVDPGQNAPNPVYISTTDLGLNTVYNHNTNQHTHDSKPIENKAIPTGVTLSGSGFVHNDLYPMIFIRPVHGTDSPPNQVPGFNAGDPWSNYIFPGSTINANSINWELEVPDTAAGGASTPPGVRPDADLYHTCPFGAQFEFEHFIPSS